MEKKEENLTIIISKYELSGNENKNWLKKMVLNKERMFKKKKKMRIWGHCYFQIWITWSEKNNIEILEKKDSDHYSQIWINYLK